MSKKNHKPIPDTIKRVLYHNANNRCSICKTELIQKVGTSIKNIGDCAHIVADSPDGPRGCLNQENDNSESNLILLCKNCHKTIDDAPEEYTVERLKEIKQNHIDNMARVLEIAMADFSFPELEDIINSLADSDFYDTHSTDFKIMPSDKKITKNNLSHKVKNSIVSGMVRYDELEFFFTELEKSDNAKRKKVINSFKSEYFRLDTKFEGDDLFYELLEYTQSGFHDDRHRQAGLALLSYLFHICEVFENDFT